MLEAHDTLVPRVGVVDQADGVSARSCEFMERDCATRCALSRDKGVVRALLVALSATDHANIAGEVVNFVPATLFLSRAKALHEEAYSLRVRGQVSG